MTPPLPPACANCQTTTQFAQGGISQSAPTSMVRSSDGKMRIDTGTTSVITDPKAQRTIVLDHVHQTAQVLPMQPPPPQPGALKTPGAPAFQPPAAPAFQFQDLGKSMIEGHEVDGRRYIIQPPAPPSAPALKPLPSSPAPGAPQPPMPAKPPAPPMPTIAEVWTSSKLGLPVLTKISGPFGQQVSRCKAAPIQEPNPAHFQIPPGYKPMMPPPPTPPKG